MGDEDCNFVECSTEGLSRCVDKNCYKVLTDDNNECANKGAGHLLDDGLFCLVVDANAPDGTLKWDFCPPKGCTDGPLPNKPNGQPTTCEAYAKGDKDFCKQDEMALMIQWLCRKT